ncbi:2-amino-4-hydroxy-6-hydroxymethyldihydropteridine diphosphokinase [Synergistaceae bacterium OttesenSCG-928-I11]|nr:2-amino-4-hydroxy-6-hydroxymethyldihydropteridine diphosphokinase [Synergistaceae bacterium OttesenSCG-928-I11]
MTKAAIGVGSNIGDRLANIRRSVKMIAKHAGRLLAASDVYETPPWGVEAQPRFLNACCVVDTPLSPHELLRVLKEIEHTLGRKKRKRWGPREIDLDILLFEGSEMHTKDISIPHLHMSERAFVLVPLAQIAPDFVHTPSGKTIAELLNALPDESRREVVRITEI